jgi:hypothetical protein
MRGEDETLERIHDFVVTKLILAHWPSYANSFFNGNYSLLGCDSLSLDEHSGCFEGSVYLHL